MSFQDQQVLAVVPARGGSKGVPRKNLALVDGVSLVGRAARVAAAVDAIDVAVLSTDDDEIAEEGRRHGLEVPFLRPAELAADLSDAKDAWRHAWLEAERVFDRRFGISVLLEPSSPLRRPEDVTRTLDALVAGSHRAAATVSRTPAHYTPHKTLEIDDDGHLRPMLPDDSPSIRQYIPPQYHRNGLCYALWRDTLIERGTILEDGCVAVVVERPVVNVDEPFDLELAGWLVQREATAAGDASGGGS